ncbi:MAG TPA: hypothetical protein DHS57_01110, partial [Erysipelotrichaceae bacterium]|nr:hypothetical protein [Erysipelotrichaceae bacterium]
MQEKILVKNKGFIIPLAVIILNLLNVVLFIYSIMNGTGFIVFLSIIFAIILFILLFGIKVLDPQEALVLTLFGNYYGTLKEE